MKISFVSLLGPITIFEEGGKIVSLLFSYSEHSDSSPLLEKAKEEIGNISKESGKPSTSPWMQKELSFKKESGKNYWI